MAPMASTAMLPSFASPKVYVVRRAGDTLSVRHRGTQYVIGFRRAVEARRVLHNIHPEPEFTLLRDVDRDLGPELTRAGFADLSISIDVSATLFIPKLRGDALHPMNDGGFHLHQFPEDDFFMFPLSNNIGTVVPYSLVDETEDEFVFRSLVMDPARGGVTGR